VPLPANNRPTSGQSSWPAVIKTLLVEVLVLLGLAGAIVGYVNWSSDQAFAEFVATNKMSAPTPTSPIRAVKGLMPCDRRA